MTDEQDNKDQQLAMAAIALDEPGLPDGPKPDFEELWDWAAGEVSGDRAVQIQSHVACDAEVYSMWREIRLSCEEESLTSTSVSDESGQKMTQSDNVRQSTKRSDSSWWEEFLGWLTPQQWGGGLVAAAVLGIAVSVGLNQSGAPDAEFWADWQSPKSLDALQFEESYADEFQAVLTGMGQQMRKLSIPAVDPAGQTIPEEMPACSPGEDDCVARRELLQELGQLSVLSRLSCLIDDSGDPDRQQRLQEILQQLETEDAANSMIEPLRTWAYADASAERCGAVNRLISRTLLANNG